MKRNRIETIACVSIIAMLFASPAIAQERSTEALTRDLHSADRTTVLAALEQLQKRGTAASPAVTDLVGILRSRGWKESESVTAMEVLGAIGQPAKIALPLLVRFMVESESGDMFVQTCIERISTALGTAVVPDALSAGAAEARHLWMQPGISGDPPALFDSMALARTSFGPVFMRFGPELLPSLRSGLRNMDPFVQAEAASWLGMMGPAARDALPSLRDARRRSRSVWTRYEIDAAIKQIDGRLSP